MKAFVIFKKSGSRKKAIAVVAERPNTVSGSSQSYKELVVYGNDPQENTDYKELVELEEKVRELSAEKRELAGVSLEDLSAKREAAEPKVTLSLGDPIFLALDYGDEGVSPPTAGGIYTNRDIAQKASWGGPCQEFTFAQNMADHQARATNARKDEVLGGFSPREKEILGL